MQQAGLPAESGARSLPAPERTESLNFHYSMEMHENRFNAKIIERIRSGCVRIMCSCQQNHFACTSQSALASSTASGRLMSCDCNQQNQSIFLGGKYSRIALIEMLTRRAASIDSLSAESPPSRICEIRTHSHCSWGCRIYFGSKIGTEIRDLLEECAWHALKDVYLYRSTSKKGTNPFQSRLVEFRRTFTIFCLWHNQTPVVMTAGNNKKNIQERHVVARHLRNFLNKSKCVKNIPRRFDQLIMLNLCNLSFNSSQATGPIKHPSALYTKSKYRTISITASLTCVSPSL